MTDLVGPLLQESIDINHRGPLVWPTQSKVVRFEPHHEIAFRIKDNFTIWSFSLTDNGVGGTTVPSAAKPRRVWSIWRR